MARPWVECYSERDIEVLQQYLAEDGSMSFFDAHPLLTAYEADLASFHSKQYGILCNSGTNALFSAFFALNLRPGDEVLVQASTFFASYTPLLRLGLIPVPVDCDPNTGALDLSEAERWISPRTKALLITPMWGHVPDLNEIAGFCSLRKLFLIEDISTSLGARGNGVLTGSIGHITCASLGSNKLLSGGQGGVILMQDRLHYERSLTLGHFGRCKLEVKNEQLLDLAKTGAGLNLRMHPLAVVVSRARFERLEHLVEARRQRYHMVLNALREKSSLEIPDIDGDRGSWHSLNIRCRPEVIPQLPVFSACLQQLGVWHSIRQPYPLPDELHWLSQHLDTKPDIPGTRRFFAGRLYLQSFVEEDLDSVKLYADRLLQGLNSSQQFCTKRA